MQKRLVALALALSGIASHVGAADLLSLYREANTADPSLAAARASTNAARERVAIAQAANGLQATLNAGANLNYGGFNTFDPKTNADRAYATASVSANASYPLVRPQNAINILQADAAVSLAEIQLDAVRQDLILRLAQAYFDVLQAQDTLVLVGAQKAAVSELLAQAKRNFEVGTATIVDTNEAQARYDQTLAQEVLSQNDLETKRWALAAVVGRYETLLKGLRAGVDAASPTPNNLDAWANEANLTGYSVKLAQQQVAVSQWDVERQKRANDWTLDLVGNAGTSLSTGSVSSNIDTFGRNATIGLQFSLPLFTNGLTDARMREALATTDKLRYDVETARRSVSQSARSAYLGVVSGISSIRAQQQALRSAETVLESTKTGLEVGVRTNLDVLNAQQALFQVRRDLAVLRYNAIVNSLRLKAATGTLDERDVIATNAYLE